MATIIKSWILCGFFGVISFVSFMVESYEANKRDEDLTALALVVSLISFCAAWGWGSKATKAYKLRKSQADQKSQSGN